MEAIPIANCSSTLPPLTQRVVPSKGLSRNLFGPVDHQEISAILNSELKRDMEEKNEEWCFNFSEGTPLGHGRLLWEKVPQRTDDELSTKSQESVVKDTRIPILHSEQCNYILGISQDIGAQCSEVATDAILKPTVTLQKSSISRKETPSNENDIPPSSDRKRKRQCRTITGNVLLFFFRNFNEFTGSS